MKRQSGFTLVELMVVIAIIGVLTMFGLPMYQNYTAKAQATEALQITAGLRTEIAVFLATDNRWASASDINTEHLLAGRYINAGGVTLSGGDAGASVTKPTTPTVISVLFSSGANSGSAMTLTPTASDAGQLTRWTCAPATNNGIDVARLPKSCQ